MNKTKTLIAAALLFVSGQAFSQSEDSVMIKKISDEILLNGKAYANLHILCKTVGHRLSGSPGMYKGEAWLVQKKHTCSNVWCRIGFVVQRKKPVLKQVIVVRIPPSKYWPSEIL